MLRLPPVHDAFHPKGVKIERPVTMRRVTFAMGASLFIVRTQTNLRPPRKPVNIPRRRRKTILAQPFQQAKKDALVSRLEAGERIERYSPGPGYPPLIGLSAGGRRGQEHRASNGRP